MSWNNGTERKKFESKQKKLAVKYREVGMTEEQIKILYELDLGEYNSNRRYQTHTQMLSSSGFDDGEDSLKSVLLQKFESEFSVTIDDSMEHSRYWWIEEIDSPKLSQALKKLSYEDIEILTLLVCENYSQASIARIMNTQRQNICNKIARIRKFLKEQCTF